MMHAASTSLAVSASMVRPAEGSGSIVELRLGGHVRQRGSRLHSQPRDAQLGLIDHAFADLNELVAALEEAYHAFEIDSAIFELLDHVLQLAVGGFKGARLGRTRLGLQV